MEYMIRQTQNSLNRQRVNELIEKNFLRLNVYYSHSSMHGYWNCDLDLSAHCQTIS